VKSAVAKCGVYVDDAEIFWGVRVIRNADSLGQFDNEAISFDLDVYICTNKQSR
jgi:hypothetical protein